MPATRTGISQFEYKARFKTLETILFPFTSEKCRAILLVEPNETIFFDVGCDNDRCPSRQYIHSDDCSDSKPLNPYHLQLIILFEFSITFAVQETASDTISSEEVIEENNDTLIMMNGSGGGTLSGRGVISDIATIKKIAEVLETVGVKVIPALVEGTGGGSTSNAAETHAKVPIGLHLLHALKQQETANDDILTQ